MSDSPNPRASVRASTFLNRPHIAPMGPRTRQSTLRVPHILDNSFTSPPPTGLDLPEFGSNDTEVPMSPIRAMSASPPPISPEPSILSSHRSLAVLEEETSSAEELTPAYMSDDDASVEVPAPKPEAKVFTLVPPPKLVPPPAIKFQTTPITWKGLPMEAALWTVDSQELQDLVSRAIRASARESFIRLLTIDNLDTILPAELVRLDELKTQTQSRYRFLVHRRTMLFHALNSTNLAHQKDGEDGVSALAKLTSQLSETITECEQHLEEVMNINDQVAQINKLIDLHWGSALAIALRKLNTSYARRTSELKDKKELIKQLEAELEDAWKEAEKVAGELDDYEAAIEADNTEAIIETAEIVLVPRTTTPNRRSSIPMPMTPTLLAVITNTAPTSPRASIPPTPLSPLSHSSPQLAFPSQISAKAKEIEAVDVPDTASTRSAKSSRSRKSSWTVESTHTNQVQAAKKRSQRASQNSLRLATGPRKQSRGHRTPPEEKPPVPELPSQFASFNGAMISAGANVSSTLLAFDTHINPSLRRRGSWDSVLTAGGRSHTTASAYQGRTADDLYIKSKNYSNHASAEIQLVPRTPKAQNFALYHSSTMPSRPPPKDPSKSIPSMWMNVDAVKPQVSQHVPLTTFSPQVPATSSYNPPSTSSTQISATSSDRTEAAVGIKRQNSTPRSNTYSKLRGLTKRYSISLPMFNTKPSQSWSLPRKSG